MIFDLAGEGQSVVSLVKEKEDFSGEKTAAANMKPWNPERSSCLCGELYMYTQWKLNMGHAANERGRELWALPYTMRSP